MGKRLKNLIIITVVAIVLVILYMVFFGKTSAPTSGSGNLQSSSSLKTTSGNPVQSIVNPQPLNEVEASQIGQEFINQLVNLQAIKLDDSVFSSLSFESLEDFTIILVQPGNEGRANPFAPFGIDGDPAATTTTAGVTDTGINVTPASTLPNGATTTTTSSSAPISNNS
jgi:hypothetical protein